MAVNPANARHVVVTAIEFAGSYADAVIETGFAPVNRVYVSTDGGLNYKETGPLPTPVKAQPSSNDPTLAWDPRGPLYAAYGAFDGSPYDDVDHPDQGAWVARSDDGGRTWRGQPVQRFTRNATVCSGPDKPAVAVDPRRGTVYATYQYLFASPDCREIKRSETRYVRSDDGGRTWSAPRLLSAPKDDAFGTAPRVLPDGTLVVTYLGDSNADGLYPECANIWIGATVARVNRRGAITHHSLAPVACAVAKNGSQYGVHNLPTLEVLPGGRLVAALSDMRVEDQGLLILTSDDGGISWRRGRVAARPGHLLGYPQLAAGGGRVALLYLDSAPGGLYQPTVVSSANRGDTWSAPTALAGLPSVGNQHPYQPFDPYTIGHYQGLAVGADRVAHAAWPDLRPDDRPHDVDIWVRGLPLP